VFVGYSVFLKNIIVTVKVFDNDSLENIEVSQRAAARPDILTPRPFAYKPDIVNAVEIQPRDRDVIGDIVPLIGAPS
jgi:hypothetical protein